MKGHFVSIPMILVVGFIIWSACNYQAKGDKNCLPLQFTDSTKSGWKDTTAYLVADSIAIQSIYLNKQYIKVEFYTGYDNCWSLQQSFDSLPCDFYGNQPKINDFDGNGTLDALLPCKLGARMSNVFGHLFLSHEEGDTFSLIGNSIHKSNLGFDTAKTMTYSVNYHSGATYRWYMVVGDSLKEKELMEHFHEPRENGLWEIKEYYIIDDAHQVLDKVDSIKIEEW